MLFQDRGNLSRHHVNHDWALTASGSEDRPSKDKVWVTRKPGDVGGKGDSFVLDLKRGKLFLVLFDPFTSDALKFIQLLLGIPIVSRFRLFRRRERGWGAKIVILTRRHFFQRHIKKTMQQVLKALEQQPISLGALKQKLPGYVKCMLYDDLPAKGSLNAVMGRAKCLVVLYMMHDSNRSVGHYSTILRLGKGKYEYFSSYGLSPEAEIHKTHSSGKLLRLLGKDFVRSTASLQEKTHSNTCARWAAARCLLHEVPIQVFVKQFTKGLHLRTPDDLITMSTMFLFDR